MMPVLRSSAPPPTTAIERWTVADVVELRPLRASLRQALDAQFGGPHGQLDDVAERMTVVATELATNALRHARAPAVVTLGRTKRSLVLDVADDQPLSVPQIADQGPAAGGGRGLILSQELALDTGWYVAGGSKHVWAQFIAPRRGRRFQAPRIPVFDLGAFARLFRRLHG